MAKQHGPIALITLVCAALAASTVVVQATEPGELLVFASNVNNEKVNGNARDSDKVQTSSQNGDAGKKSEKTPEEKMSARFPQPVKVGHLIGLPVLDGNDSTIGYVQQVVRTPGDKIQLIVPYGKRFGWARDGGLFAWGRRPVAVPIEVVVILARQINAVDMDREAFDKAPTWVAGQDQPIPPDQTVKIGLGRR